MMAPFPARCLRLVIASMIVLPILAGSVRAGELPPFPGVGDAIRQADDVPAPGVSNLQRRLMMLEGALAVGHLPCTADVRMDPNRGLTVGCVQFGLLGRLQPVLQSMDQATPGVFALALGPDVEAVRAMLRLPTTQAQVAWARSIADGDNNLPGPWRQAFTTLAATPEFQSAYLASTTTRYQRAAGWAVAYGFESRRGLAMMFDLALFRGMSADQEVALTAIMRSPALLGSDTTSELRRLRAFADARSGMEPDPQLRFHLATFAEGRADFLGYDLDLAAFGITLEPIDK